MRVGWEAHWANSAPLLFVCRNQGGWAEIEEDEDDEDDEAEPKASVRVWDLATGELAWEHSRPQGLWSIHAALGVVVMMDLYVPCESCAFDRRSVVCPVCGVWCVHVLVFVLMVHLTGIPSVDCRIEVYDLATGALLVAPVRDISHYSVLHRVLVLGDPSADVHILYWDPAYPNRISEIKTFDQWKSMVCLNDLIFFNCGNGEYLLWHISLGCGVRTVLPELNCTQLWYLNGAFFVQGHGSNLYLVPLMRYEGEEAAALARPLVTSVPADLPLVTARKVSLPTLAGGSCAVRASHWGDPTMRPPLILVEHKSLCLIDD